MIIQRFRLTPWLWPAALVLASCGGEPSGESSAAHAAAPDRGARLPFTISSEQTGLSQPWAMAFEPGTSRLFVTGRRGAITIHLPDGRKGAVSGLPKVDYGGQGGLGDIAFAPDYATSRMVYLSWAEAGDGDTRGAALGRARLECASKIACRLQDLTVIWRQQPKVSGRGHYSHRIAFSPDGEYLFLASGDRQKMAPAQELSGNLGKVLRLLPDGAPAPGNPFAARGGSAAQVWSLGHRNILGLRFDAQGRLWDLEHGPAGGDELNLVRPGANYGWPETSDGDHYDGTPIPRHAQRPQFVAPAISWNPVIAPGNFIFHDGRLFPEWKGQALIAGLKSKALIRVAIEGDKAREVARYPMSQRLRDIAQGPDGAIWLIEDDRDGAGARLLRLTPR